MGKIKSMTLTAQERARRIKIILFDVDGVLTNGGIWIIPVPVAGPDGAITTKMVEAKGYSAHDGAGMTLARLGGMKVGIITKRISETVALRARDLKLEFVYQGEAFKMRPVREIMQREGVTLDEIAFVGDDVIDLAVMRQCGFAVAVANAREQVKAEAHYVTPHRGGEGAGRDAIEFILEAKGLLEKCIEASIDESNPLPPSMDIGKGGDLADSNPGSSQDGQTK
jgi:3-deoxy-D-manno-octulosonate 8-phosphate phosphatase (KDO 8-P phosphatase)